MQGVQSPGMQMIPGSAALVQQQPTSYAYQQGMGGSSEFLQMQQGGYMMMSPARAMQHGSPFQSSGKSRPSDSRPLEGSVPPPNFDPQMYGSRLTASSGGADLAYQQYAGFSPGKP
mmetsp:Transcript_38043/g.89909  ORF Transcript_38043/g.89909 Transcript_38043/m.89909 type:complete len:116 (-) Transcript_38043:517-864(-)